MIEILKRFTVTALFVALNSPTAKAEFAHAYCSSILTSRLTLNVGNLSDEEYRELLVAGFDALNKKYGQITIKIFKRHNQEADKILTEALGMPMTTNQFYELLPHTLFPMPEVYRRLKAGTLSPRYRMRVNPPKLKPLVAPASEPTEAIQGLRTFAPVSPPEVTPPTTTTQKTQLQKSAANPRVKFETQYASTDQEQREFVKRILTNLYQAGKKPNMAYLYTLETRPDPDLGSKVINGVMYGYNGSLYDALVDAKINPRQVLDLIQANRQPSPDTLMFRARQVQTFRKPTELLKQTAQAISMEFTYRDLAPARVLVYELLQHPSLTTEQLYAACEEFTRQPLAPAEFNRILRAVSRNYTLNTFLNNLARSK